ncbi:MFS transporter [Promicromonospora thailandica]|uniref:Arabinose efflux permease, MFS family n=1 Tax=Promicromonospora thailandica TaxID=765201 RepID=A0A9X2JVI9_9MICO|nr:MFS transporter [Promicromonospora thailandica]MCP2265111.1 putative arabinose efflux permease, MFS family [Promicromonospora thailandica]
MTFIEQSYSLRGAYLRIALIAAALFVVGTNAFVIAGVLPQIAVDIGASPSAVSYSISWYAVVVAVLAPAVSVLFARASRAALMGTGLWIIAAGIALSALAGDLALFTAGRVLAALGGAALMPAAMAAAPTLVPPEQRGRALGVVGFGFILATAVGSPLGTALAALGGWRLALGVLAGLAAGLAVAVGLATRAVPTGAVPGLLARFAVLRDVRIGLALMTTLLFTAAFNLVYIFSSAVTESVTGGSGLALASLLLVFGLAGIVGNWLGGSFTDRFGARPTALAALAAVVVSLAALYTAGGSYAGTAVLFGVWGLGTAAALVPIQHRLVDVDPAVAGVSLSWYSTAMYLGIALAPVVGASVLPYGAAWIDLLGAGAAAAALGVFALGYAVRRRAALA